MNPSEACAFKLFYLSNQIRKSGRVYDDAQFANLESFNLDSEVNKAASEHYSSCFSFSFLTAVLYI